MAWVQPTLAFPKAEQYAFLYENAHLLMLSWERDNAKFLFLIVDQKDGELVLDYPGERFTNTVLDTIENIFLIQVQEESGEAKRYALGSYFVAGSRRYGAYYERETESEEPNVVLFRIEGEAPDLSLEVLDEDEYQEVAQIFVEQHNELHVSQRDS
ncbi:DUF1292 domain-containing protein [Alicyclobacillus cycloheptanicus]|uniref:Uncharacterized protein n=1 Tax=Alicyclobacillus cycloheptanicus TaxID=1457 RepID=A0ABT9XLP0_9BACL|nr:DUF1292 domain-containing protein [Alicyclobacillus cycloheptanicus]MDQ0191230.1 hypothetical protein [Alicyclobacillus cycloheptanicus]WDM01533.1 DUF1292 domain-containing protein [Alicyclobacillus cycloheptanicus]